MKSMRYLMKVHTLLGLLYLIINTFLLFFATPKGWDYPTYILFDILGKNSLNELFHPIRDCLLFIIPIFLHLYMNLDAEISFTLLIYSMVILQLIYVWKWCIYVENKSRNVTHKQKIMLKILFFTSYLFSPLLIYLMNLYRQFFMQVFLLIAILHIFYFLDEIKKEQPSIKKIIYFACISIISNFFVISSSIMAIFTQLIILSLIFIPSLSETIDLNKKQRYYYYLLIIATFFVTELFLDIILKLFFFNEQRPLSNISPIAYSVLQLVRVLTKSKYTRYALIFVNLFNLLLLFAFFGINRLINYVKEKYKIPPLKFLLVINYVLFVFCILNSVILKDYRSDFFRGFPFAAYYIWGGFLTIFLLISIKLKHYPLLKTSDSLTIFSLISNIIIFSSVLLISFVEQILGYSYEEGLYFPKERLYILLFLPFAILSYKSFLVILEKDTLKQFFIRYIIGGVITVSIIVVLSVLQVGFSNFYVLYIAFVNSNVYLTGFFIWSFLILIARIDIKFDKMNFNKVRFVKKIKISRNSMFFILIMSQLLFTILSIFVTPSVISTDELEFIETIKENVDRGSILAVAPYQYPWVILKTNNNTYNVLSLTTIEKMKNLAGAYQSENQSLIIAIMDFLDTPSNETWGILQTKATSSFYVWISMNSRYNYYVPYNLSGITLFFNPVIHDNYNYLFYISV